jgi:hypothetical protein
MFKNSFFLKYIFSLRKQIKHMALLCEDRKDGLLCQVIAHPASSQSKYSTSRYYNMPVTLYSKGKDICHFIFKVRRFYNSQ